MHILRCCLLSFEWSSGGLKGKGLRACQTQVEFAQHCELLDSLSGIVSEMQLLGSCR